MATRFTRNLRDQNTGKFSGREIWIRCRSAFAVLLSLSVLTAGGLFVYNNVSDLWTEVRTSEDYIGEGTEDVIVTIPQVNLSDISDILVEAGVVRTAEAFDRAIALRNNGNPPIQAGHYKLKKELPAETAMDWLLDKKHVANNPMTLAEGMWLKGDNGLIATMAKKTEIPAADFEKLLLEVPNPQELGLPGWFSKGKSAEGYIFPATYNLYDLSAEATALDVIKLTTTQFNAVATKLKLEERAKALSKQEGLKLTANDLVIVASIIEREVNRDVDRAKVARVIYNRLRRGMKLQMDSTAAYGVGKTGVIATTAEDRTNQNPYNTYYVEGLPGAPISNPGEAALTAAANPTEKNNWVYFAVSNPGTGETRFCSNEACHAETTQMYRAWCLESDENYKVCYGADARRP